MSTAAPALHVTTPTDREIVMSRVLNAPRDLVFDAWTNPKHLPNWMLGPPGWSMPVCEIDLRPGGSWHMIWRSPDGQQLEMRGKYHEIIWPERIVSTESWGGDWPETHHTLTFTEANGQTTFHLRILYPSKEARDAALRTGMAEGMSHGFARLDVYLRQMG